MTLSRLKVYLLIFLSIFILTHFLHLFQNTQITPNDRLIVAEIIVDQYSRNCFYVGHLKQGLKGSFLSQETRVGIKLKNCSQYRLGSQLEVVGTQLIDSANKNSTLKILKDPVIVKNSLSLGSLFIKLRVKILRYFRQTLGSPEAEVLFSLMFGGRNFLPEEIKTQLEVLGLNHLLAVSGLHLTILSGVLWFLFKSLPKKVAVMCLTVFLVFYSCLTLFRPSVVRAGVMILMLFYAREVFYRHYRSWWGLLFAGLTLVAISPKIIFSISFQFSFLAVFSLVLLGSRDNHDVISLEVVSQKLFLSRPAKNLVTLDLFKRLGQYFKGSLKLSLVVNLTLFPLVVHYFQAFSLWSFVSSALFIWFLPVLFIFGLVLLVFLPWTYLGQLGWIVIAPEALPLKWLLDLFLASLRFLSQVDWLYLDNLSLSVWQVGLWYLVLSLGFAWIKLKGKS